LGKAVGGWRSAIPDPRSVNPLDRGSPVWLPTGEHRSPGTPFSRNAVHGLRPPCQSHRNRYLFIKIAIDDGMPPAFLAWLPVVLAAVEISIPFPPTASRDGSA